jgi:4-amino-4-deoxy-L-arabinose transferase-like glycosyltransferase
VTLVTLVAALALQGPVAGALFVVSALSYLASLNLQPKLCLHAWLRKNPAGDLLLAVLVVGAVVLPWFVAESVITQGRFFYEFIIRENFGRLSGTVNHQNPFVWFYIPFLLAGFFPWKQPDGSQKLAQYASCWLIVVVVLFTLVSTKLPTYILPALPPWAVLTGLILDRWIAAKNYKSVTGLCGCVAALSWIGCCALGYFVYVHTPLLSNPTVNVVLAAGVAVLAITSSWALLAALQKKLALSVYALLGGYACFVACFMPAALIINDAQLQQPLRSLVATAGRAHGSLSTFLRDSHAAVYYLKARVPLLLNEPQYEQFVRTQPAPHFTLTPVNLLPVLQARIPNVRVLARSSKWALCSLDAEHK